MSRATVNFLLDCFLLVNFVVLAWCGTIVRFVFPPAMASSGWTLWGWNYTGWANLQYTLTSVLAVAVLVHVMLHWNWVCGYLLSHGSGNKKVKLDEGSKTLYGVGLLIAILGLAGSGLIAAHQMIRGP